MNKTIQNIFLLGSLLFALFLGACSRSSDEITSSYPLGTLWDVQLSEEGEADWDSASPLAQEQHTGFELANASQRFTEVIFSEGNRQDDVQTAIRQMVEGQAEGTDDAVIAILGATSNEASTRSTALANFFQVPMLIPSASGDNLLSENNLWAFQLSAPNSAYADYILGTVLTKQALSFGLEDDEPPVLPIAILYEQNTYGESAAVTTATAAMQQEFEVMVYEKFDAENPSATRLRVLVNQVLDQDVQVVFIISSNPDITQALLQTFDDLIIPELTPLMVGIASGFTSQEFLETEYAEKVFILRQEISPTDCPAEIKTLYAAQNYAAIKLLEYAVAEVESLPAEKAKLALPTENTIAIYRETLRDTLKTASLQLPCLGEVAFDNSGQNKFLNFEIVKVEDGEIQNITAEDFLSIVKEKFGLTDLE